MNVVLVHGILGSCEKFAVSPEHFTENGHQVLAPILDPTWGVEYRGSQLRDPINGAFAKGTSIRPRRAFERM
jgi:hypothetical protein